MSQNTENQEKMVNLNEDSKKHEHDATEFEKLKRQQEANKNN